MTSILGLALGTVFENSWEVQMGYSFIHNCVTRSDPCLLPPFLRSKYPEFLRNHLAYFDSSLERSLLVPSSRYKFICLVRAEEAMNNLDKGQTKRRWHTSLITLRGDYMKALWIWYVYL